MVDVTKISGFAPPSASGSGKTQSSSAAQSRETDEKEETRSEPVDEVSFSAEAQSLQEAESAARAVRENLERYGVSLSPPGSLTDFQT